MGLVRWTRPPPEEHAQAPRWEPTATMVPASGTGDTEPRMREAGEEASSVLNPRRQAFRSRIASRGLPSRKAARTAPV